MPSIVKRPASKSRPAAAARRPAANPMRQRPAAASGAATTHSAPAVEAALLATTTAVQALRDSIQDLKASVDRIDHNTHCMADFYFNKWEGVRSTTDESLQAVRAMLSTIERVEQRTASGEAAASTDIIHGYPSEEIWREHS